MKANPPTNQLHPVKTLLPLAALTAFALSLSAADVNPKDDVLAAAKKLGERPNYSWKATVVVPESAQFKPGPTEGRTEKDGCAHFSTSFGDSTWQVVKKGDAAVTTNQEGEWQSVKELESEEGRGRFMARMVRAMQTPAAQVAEFIAGVKELKKEGDAFVGSLTEEAVKSQFRGGNATEAKGSVKVWIKDGLLVKYEFKVQGKVTFGGNEMDVDRTTTVEIKDIGTTKVVVPEEARKKLSA